MPSPRPAPSIIAPPSTGEVIRLALAAWTLGHAARVRVLHEVASGQLDRIIIRWRGDYTRLTDLTPAQHRELAREEPGWTTWLEVYNATADGRLTREERRRIRARVVHVLRAQGRTGWADVLATLG